VVQSDGFQQVQWLGRVTRAGPGHIERGVKVVRVDVRAWLVSENAMYSIEGRSDYSPSEYVSIPSAAIAMEGDRYIRKSATYSFGLVRVET